RSGYEKAMPQAKSQPECVSEGLSQSRQAKSQPESVSEGHPQSRQAIGQLESVRTIQGGSVKNVQHSGVARVCVMMEVLTPRHSLTPPQ
ncbi:MAG: hypothetical protein KDB00_25195, partial [Planctomycetales bacterium]|nr:hypothetical protein [Planctomycetales bacterium]